MSGAPSDLQAVHQLNQARERINTELRKAIVGQDEVIDQLLTALFSGGHVLLVGVPGLAKTLLISSLAKVLDLLHAMGERLSTPNPGCRSFPVSRFYSPSPPST